MKRIFLFVVMNLAVIFVMSIVLRLLGVDTYLTARGINFSALLVFSLVVGFTGSIISLFMSKSMAKWSTGAQVIVHPRNHAESWLLDTVSDLAYRANINCPEVAIYEGEPNAFATGAFKNSALVAVSTGLLQNMNKEEVRAVLGHEISHVANGDMVTMALLQGVLNTFVIFVARVVGFAVDSFLSKNNDENRGGVGFFVTVLVCQIVFGMLANVILAWFSRRREYKADAGAADLLGSPAPMINALYRLGGMVPGALPKNITAAGIATPGSLMSLFATHPPLEKRIEALKNRAQ